jgi:hypothetical protein
MLGLNQPRKARNLPASSVSSKLGDCDNARDPDSLTAGMMRAEAYMTKTRYAKEMITDGVMVIIAAQMKLNEMWMVDGKVERACMMVLYDAIIIGGSGGKAG